MNRSRVDGYYSVLRPGVTGPATETRIFAVGSVGSRLIR